MLVHLSQTNIVTTYVEINFSKIFFKSTLSIYMKANSYDINYLFMFFNYII